MSGSFRPDQSKIHETKEDRAREAAIVATFAAHMNFKVWKNTDLTSHDVVFYNGETRLKAAAAEVKHRNNKRDAYPTYRIDADKIDALWRQTQKQKIRAFLIVEWLNEVWYCEFKTKPDFRSGGMKRNDRDENKDKVYDIPIENFIQLEERKIEVAEVAPGPELPHEQTCAGCYEVAPGIKIHPPKVGQAWQKWRDEWEKRALEKEAEQKRQPKSKSRK